MQVKIAITGANGFLAGYLINDLLESGHDLVLISRGSGSRQGVAFTQTDYSKESVASILTSDIDGIVHLASTRKVYSNISMYSDLLEVTNNLYDTAVETGVKNIVFTSSISVYGGNSLPFSENQKPAPVNMYGLFKLISEELGNMYNRKYGLKIKNLRLAHLYGANENNNYMINRFFRQAFNHEQLSVYCKSVAHREMMYAKDAAKAIRLALDNKSISGTYNAGSGDCLTNEDIADIICSVMSPEQRVLKGDAVEEIVSSYMDSSNIKEVFGYTSQYDLRKAVNEIYQDMKTFLKK